jgi:hypothetical protein
LFTSSGDNALTTMLILGRNSASYYTHKTAIDKWVIKKCKRK